MSISGCSFSMQQHHSDAHELQINFLNKKGLKLSSKEFIFERSHFPSEQGAIHDVASQNGICRSEIVKNLFKEKDKADTKEILSLSNGMTAKKIIALDIKNKQGGYLNNQISAITKIAASENAILEFFKSKVSDDTALENQMHKLFSSAGLNYIFNEGSLKTELLTKGNFTEKQVEYLNAKKGGMPFCQVAEFFMNGCKLGYEIKNFKIQDFVATVDDVPFKPHTESTVFYPSSYAKLYSPESPYFEALGNCYQVSGYKEKKTNVSVVTVTLPKGNLT